MKKTIIFIIFALSIYGQDATELKNKVKTLKNNRQYSVKYDKFTDKTSVVFRGQILNSTMSYVASGTMIQLNLGFAFESPQLKTNIDDYFLFFTATGKDWSFLKTDAVYFLLDGERLQLENGERDSEIKKSVLEGYKTSETLAFQFDRKTLEKLAKAQKLEIKIGKVEAEIKETDKRAFQNMLDLGMSGK